ncbi:putative ribonuclease H-like domain-containing protein [Tanacetum coccineum]
MFGVLCTDFVEFKCLLELVTKSVNGSFLSFIVNIKSIISMKVACVFTDKWSLDELAYGIPTNGPYQTNPPSPDDIISSIRIDREGQVRRIRHEEEIDVLEYQVLTREVEPTLKPLEEIIRENVFCLGGELKRSSSSNSASQNLAFLSSENTNSTNEALVAQDGLGGYDWSNDFEVEPVNYALMAISLSNSSSSSDSEVRSSDEESTLANNRFTKANEYHVVPPLITGNPLTPRPDISFAGLDKYAFRNKIIIMSKVKINRDEVIIEDWTSDDKDDVCAVKPVSSVKRNVTQAVRSQADKSGQTSQNQGIGFKKVHKIKACFVCKSTGHLIKDCDFYDQKSPEPRVKNVVNTGERVVKPVWDYGKRVNHQNFSKNLKYPHAKRTFNPSAVLTRAVLLAIGLKIANLIVVLGPNHPRLDIVRPKASNTPIKRSYFTQPVYRPKDLKPDVKTFGVNNMTTVGTRAVVSKGKVENVLKKDKWGNPEILLQDHAVVDSGCSSHMTGNKAYLSDYEDLNGGFMAFGSDPKGGKITGKGKIKTANLDFDDVYFVDELKFNLFSVSQMCDKKNSVLFTESECLILSPSVKLLDESQVVLRAPRKDGVDNLDLKNIVPSGADLVSKANRVYNKRTKRVEENLHINFLEDQPNVAGTGPNWMFDLDFLTNSMNYIPISVENQVIIDAGQILGDPTSAVQTRGKIQKAFLAYQALKTQDISQPKRMKDGYEAIQEEFAPFQLQQDWILMDISFLEEKGNALNPYKVVKALYGLHQAPRAWYETLSFLLLENGFRRGTIDKTLFIKKNKSDIMLVQVYVDDNIFGSIKQSMCTEFEEVMHERFQMSSMGELTFFLGLQVKQQPDGIFISQDKYVADILKMFDFCSIKTATTPIESNKPLVKDEDSVEVDVHDYRSSFKKS